MGEPAIPLFLGAGENAVTKTKCAPFSALNNTQARRWLALSFPALGNGDDVLPVHIDDAQNRHFRHAAHFVTGPPRRPRSEEHTSELPSLMRISYAVFCSKKKTT